MHDSPERLHALDAVRAFALLLGIVLHATMSFMPGLIAVGWPIADRSQSEFLQGTFFFIHVFRMTMFFVIAGFFAHLLFHRRGASGFIRDRLRRVGIPLVVGWLILAPMIIATLIWAAWGSPPPAPPPGFEKPALPFPLMHLWFLYVLALLYVVVLVIRQLIVKLPNADAIRARADASMGWLVRSPVAAMVLAIPVATALHFYQPWMVHGGIPTPDMSLIPNSPAFIAFATAFCFGWLLHRQTTLLSSMQRGWVAYLATAIVLTSVALFMVSDLPSGFFAKLEGLPRLAYAVIYGIASWCWTFAIIGAAMRYLSRERPVVRYLADSSYWLYLLHLPLVFALQQLVSEWPLHWSVKYPLIVSVTTALLLLSYRAFVRSTYIGEVLNGRRYPKGLEKGLERPSTVVAAPATSHSHDPQKTLASLKAVKKRYGSTLALDGLDLNVGKGELVAVLGPNGAGKSTAIGLMLGLQRPDQGAVSLFDESPESLAARRRVGVMMQEVALAPELRVRELIDLTASYYAAPMTAEAAMEMTHTKELALRPYGKLSGGQKRQVQFAMAICGRPQLLFLDEPTVGLDIRAREMMWSTIRELVRGGCSIVLTTHYLEEAESLADRVIVVAKGRVIASGSVDEMRALVSRRRVSCTTSTPIAEIERWPDVDSVSSTGGRVLISTARAEDVVRRLLAADATLSDLEVQRAGLSEAFTELTQEAA
ncbi:ABC-type multidrug transport system ATPase subunit/peptidoglycan/LPS O-acetylase OafA/YrhL [Povalibacter uvarum]|uniref:ABC-type multidrug transport system ATPase subunit/peptidoglycan/LPS O-acetylase OafA/YrhL n=1 Tax=Povalibacter uvarum TaxID=732238 RepID=A0A841HSZ8_9GAMM|nr:acyltransferase family protein [Povalibacter uvarum]MBB6095429.1 ABC-type multidrug transport system ATPase subunit/peptidoglycan/LPS O-acetylase OafA/YrhL [Povalibacter uvarum]